MNARPVVLLGFGGPACEEEVRPFLDRVLQGRPVSRERYETVVQHYAHLGGRSPFNELTRRQADALAHELSMRGVSAGVHVGYLNAMPFADEVISRLEHEHNRPPIAVILASFQSPASWERYAALVPNARIVPPYYEHPLFVQAHAERVAGALQRLGKPTFDGVHLIFTAHSIPQSMAKASPYVEQFTRCAQRVAQAVDASSWQLAYQSRSGSPREPWLEPDIGDVLRGAHDRDAIVAPIGFLCDHVEVLYDLDVEAAAAAAAAGVRMERAAALNDHPLFIRMLADLVQEQCAAA